MASETNTSVSADWLKWVAWLDKNKKRVAIWSGSVIAVVLVVSLVAYQQKMKEIRAGEALSDVVLPMAPGKVPDPGTAEALLKVEQDHRGTQAAARALLIAGGVRFTEERYAEAEALFTRFVEEYRESPWQPQAMLGHAASLEAQGKTSEALAEYEKLQRLYGTDAIANEIKLGLAGLYEQQNKPAEALKLYQELLQLNHPAYSSVGAQASSRQEALLKQYPDLMKTNTPALTAPVMPRPNATNLQVQLGTNQARPTNRTISIPLTNLLQSTNGTAPATSATNLSLKVTPAPPPTIKVTPAAPPSPASPPSPATPDAK